MTQTSIDDPYRRLFRMPKWNGKVRVTQDHRIFRFLPEFKDWTKAQHETESRTLLSAALVQEGIYHRKINVALKRYGDHGPLICAVIRDHFPESVKTQLRMAYDITELRQRSQAHWLASGKRYRTWRLLNFPT